MPFQMAILSSLLSTSLIYVGASIGIILGDRFDANYWAYAITTGMFIYISVCDMVFKYMFHTVL